MAAKAALAPQTRANRILVIRGLRVMLDADLAELYEVETKRLNEQVRRNPDRFPPDFMLRLTAEEWANLKSQLATSSWGGRRTVPHAFTEHGGGCPEFELDQLERRVADHDESIADLVQALRDLMGETSGKPRPIGFTADLRNP